MNRAKTVDSVDNKYLKLNSSKRCVKKNNNLVMNELGDKV